MTGVGPTAAGGDDDRAVMLAAASAPGGPAQGRLRKLRPPVTRAHRR